MCFVIGFPVEPFSLTRAQLDEKEKKYRQLKTYLKKHKTGEQNQPLRGNTKFFSHNYFIKLIFILNLIHVYDQYGGIAMAEKQVYKVIYHLCRKINIKICNIFHPQSC